MSLPLSNIKFGPNQENIHTYLPLKSLFFISYSALPHTYLNMLNKLDFNKNSIRLFYILGKLTDLLQEQEEGRKERLNLMKRGILIPQGSLFNEK